MAGTSADDGSRPRPIRRHGRIGIRAARRGVQAADGARAARRRPGAARRRSRPRRPADRLGGPCAARAPGAPRPRPSASPRPRASPRWCIHRLADRDLIDYDLPVADLLARVRRGRQGADHRPRAAQPPSRPLRRPGRRAATPMSSSTTSGMERRLAAATPQGPPGRPAYHAITFGWLASGLAPSGHRKGNARTRPHRARRAPRHLRPRDRHGRRTDEPGRDGRALRSASTPLSASRPRPSSAGCRSPGPASAPCTRRASKSSAADRSPPSGAPRCPP